MFAAAFKNDFKKSPAFSKLFWGPKAAFFEATFFMLLQILDYFKLLKDKNIPQIFYKITYLTIVKDKGQNRKMIKDKIEKFTGKS